MKKRMVNISLLLMLCFALTGCLTINQKDILPAPYIPEFRETDAQDAYLYLFTRGQIDWSEVGGVYALKLSHGLNYNSTDHEAYFQIATDNEKLYARVSVKDDSVLPFDGDPSGAWDSDSVELFIGRDRRRHTRFDSTDHSIRVNIKSDGTGQMGIDDRLVPSDVAFEMTEDGYIVTFSIPFETLSWRNPLKDGDVIRAEFAYNDADSLNREHKLQWTGDDDLAYADASKWGNVTVKEVR